MDKKETKVNKNFTKLTQKKGISLIVLIVTIIVIVILAATVILTLSKNNPIESAKEARFKEDIRMFQDELNMYIASEYTKLQGQRDEKITALEYTEKGDKNSVYTYLSSFTKKYENKIAIKEDEIVYVGLDEKEREWLINSGIYMAKKITVHYKDGYGNSLKASEEYPMLDVKYHFEAPEIEGYMALNEIEEGITSGDKEITFEYCMISNDLAFIGLNSSGKETSVENEIVAYTVSGIGECNNPYVAIPREHNGKAVTQIKGSAFRANNIIKKLVISNTVEKVNGNAFERCSKLEYVKLNAKRVESYFAFDCNSNLKKVDIGESAEYISGCSFRNCRNLVDVTLYSEKVKLNCYIFEGCNLLEEVKVNEGNKSFKSVDGVVYSKDGTIIYMYPLGKAGDTYIIPSEVKEIGEFSFRGNKNLTRINIPATVEKVNGSAFESCSKLEYVSLNAKRIESYFAFASNSNLKKVDIGESAEYISGCSFRNCRNLVDVTLYSEKAKLNSYIFEGCNLLEEVKVNDENKAFKSVDGVVYSKDGTIIYMYPLGKAGDTYIIPSEVKEIGEFSFRGNKNLTRINIPATVEKVNGSAFESCSKLEYVSLNAKRVESYFAFANNSNLKKVDIGENVEYIVGWTFRNCSNLTEVNYLGTMEMWNNISKSGWNNDSSITKVICTDGEVTL